jgi:hypothetical protein
LKATDRPLGVANELTARVREDATAQALERLVDRIMRWTVFSHVGHQSFVAAWVEAHAEA